MPQPPHDLVDMTKAIEITGYKRASIDRARATGELVSYQRVRGARVYFREADLIAWAQPQPQPISA